MKITIQSILGLSRIMGCRKVELQVPEGTTVSGLLKILVEKWPDSAPLVPYLRIMKNGQAVQFLNYMETILNEGDDLLLLPLAAGG